MCLTLLNARSSIFKYIRSQQSGYLRSSIEGKEAKDEDEGPETHQRDGVCDHLNFPLSRVAPSFNLNKTSYEYFRRKSADSRTEHDGANERHYSPGQVDHARPGKVVESPGENYTPLSVNFYIYSSKYVSPSQPPPQAQWV